MHGKEREKSDKYIIEIIEDKVNQLRPGRMNLVF